VSPLTTGTAALTVDRLIALANVLDLQLVVQDKASKAGPQTDW